MDFLDSLKDGIKKMTPGSSNKAPAGFGGAGGISSSGALGFEDDVSPLYSLVLPPLCYVLSRTLCARLLLAQSLGHGASYPRRLHLISVIT